MTTKSTVRLLLRGTVAISSLTLETPASQCPTIATQRNRNAVNQMHRADQGTQLPCQSLLEETLVLRQVRGLPHKGRPTLEAGKQGCGGGSIAKLLGQYQCPGTLPQFPL